MPRSAILGSAIIAFGCTDLVIVAISVSSGAATASPEVVKMNALLDGVICCSRRNWAISLEAMSAPATPRTGVPKRWLKVNPGSPLDAKI